LQPRDQEKLQLQSKIFCLLDFLLEGLDSHRPESKQFQMTMKAMVKNYNLKTKCKRNGLKLTPQRFLQEQTTHEYYPFTR
jgi:hypothetical protein